ncbi:MAG TPA: tRNA lysidine(34) synthetase TilS [Candidatus Binataceae bacterium]|nr:tRNA lysidine(34) synthetase TilS [Candidatus Binataceae bacterium]
MFTRMRGANIKSVVLDEIACALSRIALRPDDLILLGLSGGIDSVALLHALLDLRERFGFQLACAHLNHRLRGAESDRDEAFVRELCARLGVHLTVGVASGLDPAMANLEERARDARYDFLRNVSESIGSAYIALAHHGDDQAETVLLRLLRGTGVTGLCAMAPVGPAGARRLIRPMLGLRREQISAYVDACVVTFVSDSSNNSSAMLRNRVRHELMPLLERDYAPGLGGRLVELAGEMNEVADLLDGLARRELESRLSAACELDLSRFSELHPALQRALLRSYIAEVKGDLRRIGRAHVEAMRHLSLEGSPSGQLDLGAGWCASREYAKLRLTRYDVPQERGNFAVTLKIPGITMVERAGVEFSAELISIESAQVPCAASEALFDCDRLERGLTVRNFVPGDRIIPMGMRGSRKVKRMFIDRKLAKARRAVFPVVVMGERVAWLPGIARGDVALLTPDTRRVLRLIAMPSVACDKSPMLASSRA